jgi:hypothetical protein
MSIDDSMMSPARRLVEQGDQLAGHSAVISVSAARAELSSQIDLF